MDPENPPVEVNEAQEPVDNQQPTNQNLVEQPEPENVERSQKPARRQTDIPKTEQLTVSHLDTNRFEQAQDDLNLTNTARIEPGPDVVEYDLNYKNEQEERPIQQVHNKPKVICPSKFQSEEVFNTQQERSYVPNRELQQQFNQNILQKPKKNKGFLGPLSQLQGPLTDSNRSQNAGAKKQAQEGKEQRTALPQLKKIGK